MADETTTTTTTETAAPAAETAPETPAPETATPHPLEPGGKRFEQVYGRMKQLEGENLSLREQASTKAAPPAAPQQKIWTPQELQTLVDEQKISSALMADQLAYQRAAHMQAQTIQHLEQRGRVQGAEAEVRQYIEKVPKLNDTGSEEFTRVRTAAYEISQEMGRPVTDPIVQRRALREVFGDPSKLAKVTQAETFARDHADTFAETGGGGGTATPNKDPFKGVPAAQMQHWKRLNYSHQQMLDELPYVRLTR